MQIAQIINLCLLKASVAMLKGNQLKPNKFSLDRLMKSFNTTFKSHIAPVKYSCKTLAKKKLSYLNLSRQVDARSLRKY